MSSQKRKASSELAAAAKKLQIKDVRDEKNFPSKRKFATGEESPNKKPKPPKNGQRPIFTMYLSWEGHGEVPIRTLFDSGASSFVVSSSIVRKFRVPQVRRETPVEVRNFEGVSVCETRKVHRRQ